jgi:hypothetical protein
MPLPRSAVLDGEQTPVAVLAERSLRSLQYAQTWKCRSVMTKIEYLRSYKVLKRKIGDVEMVAVRRRRKERGLREAVSANLRQRVVSAQGFFYRTL